MTRSKQVGEVAQIILAVAAFVAFLAFVFWIYTVAERYRASLWAEEMRKAGVKTEVPK